MKIDKRLLEYGLDEYNIKLLHSKTKLKSLEIDSAIYHAVVLNGILIKLILFNDITKTKYRTVSLHISKSKLRTIKLNMILL